MPFFASSQNLLLHKMGTYVSNVHLRILTYFWSVAEYCRFLSLSDEGKLIEIDL
jgi:hypothetical protein